MSWIHRAQNEDGGETTITILDLPDECPLCHNKGTFSPRNLFINRNTNKVELVFRCPNSKCYEVFIGYYSISPNGHKVESTAPGTYSVREFNETITTLSSDFVHIFNQALEAEQRNLNQIAGPGYRKALEFLIKDYLMNKADSSEVKEIIKQESLGVCIATRIGDLNIKEVAKRAAWLGNDETHYSRKWEQKDLQDLKMLIDLTVHWITAEALTTKLLKDMPEVSKTEIKESGQ